MDLNLLPHLEALLETASVSKAAERRGLSPPAMSRALARLREQTGDELLVRAGHRMVLTPRATALREELPEALDRVRRLLAAPAGGRPRVDRPFRIRTSDAVPAFLGRPLLRELQAAVDGASLVFVPEGDEDIEALRSGVIDLDIGVQQDDAGPELMVRNLFTDTFVAVTASGHPALTQANRLDAFCRYPHVAVSRRGIARGPADRALAGLGHSRDVALVVAGFLDAALLVAEGEFIALLPARLLSRLGRVLGLQSFPAPIPLPPLRVAQAWHPRNHDDPAHRALRAAVVAVITARDAATASPTVTAFPSG